MDSHRRAEGARFLSALDEDAEAFTFQTFDDYKARRAAREQRNKGKKKEDPDYEHDPLADTKHGTLDQLWPTLNDLNQQGAGIFVTVNGSVNGRRRAKDINKVWAVFADFDRPENIPETWPLEPVMLVASSPGKLHAYWTVDDLPAEDFTDLQRSIAAKLGSDPSVCDLPHVMRLPGFDHCKDPEHRHPVTLVEVNERLPYKADAIKAAFPLTHTAGNIQHAPCSAPETATSKQIDDLRSALTSMPSDDRELWVRMGHALKRLGDDGLNLWLKWSATSEKYDDADALDRWQGFATSNTGFAAVFAEAQRGGWTNPAKKVKAGPDATADQIPKAVATLTAQIAKLADDPGAVRTPEAVNAWRVVNAGDPAEFERLRARAGKAGARVGQIDKDAKACVLPPAPQENYSSRYPLVSLATGVESSRDPLGNLSDSGYPLVRGALLEEGEKREIIRVIESRAAAIIAEGLRGKIAWDGEAQTWLVWRLTHWEPLTVSVDADRLLADAVHAGTDPIGYRPTYLNGAVQILQKRGLLAPPSPVYGVVPFANGLLDLDTGALLPATPERALDWVLPHQYQPDAQCPTIKAWLLRSVEDDQATVELLRAWLAALLRGMPLQKFLLLLGRGGTGKGTFQRLALALVGPRNAAISALRDLEENRFECAKLYGRRLCMINETGKHGGSLNMLKAMTGGDHLPLERKHVQQTGSFVFDGLVLMATNEDLQSTDTTSGLERRRITVRFPKTATAEEKADWEKRGGEAAVLHSEIPGLIRWLLELTPAEIRERIENPPTRVVTDNLLGMAAGNSIADWMIESTVPDPDAWTQTGDKRERREPSTGETFFNHAEDWLYPNYLTWCIRSGRNRPVALRKFKTTVVDIAETLGHEITAIQHHEKRTQGLKGIRLRQTREDTRGWNPQSEELSPCFESNREEREDKADFYPCTVRNERYTSAEIEEF